MKFYLFYVTGSFADDNRNAGLMVFDTKEEANTEMKSIRDDFPDTDIQLILVEGTELYRYQQ